MPFDWYEPQVPRIDAKAKALQMYERELAERAALLQRLGYSRDHAVLRLRSNARWDFELHDEPAHLTAVEQIVDRVYARHGLAGGGAPLLETE